MKKSTANIGNVTFTAKRLITDIDFRPVWFREPLKNAIEAALQYIADHPEVKVPMDIRVRGWKLFDILPKPEDKGYASYTAPKLSILNYGGMTHLELRQALDLFSSGKQKVQDHKENFGVGMKLVLSKFTDVLIITKKDDDVTSAIFGFDSIEGLWISELEDQTDWAWEWADIRGYDMDHDWTEVVLLGKGYNNWLTQDTVTNTFSPVKKNSKHFALKQAFERFVDIPSNIRILFEAGGDDGTTTHNNGNKNLPLYTKDVLWERGIVNHEKETGKATEAFVETVTINGHKVTLKYDAPRNEGKNTDGNPQSSYSERGQSTSSSFSALVWGKPGERERYSIVDGKSWISAASALGIYNDHKYFNIEVELPYNLYQPTTDRTALQKENPDSVDDMGRVDYKQFVPVIKEAMAQSTRFLEKVKEHNKSNMPKDLDEMMQQALDQYYQFSSSTGMTPVESDSKGSGKQSGTPEHPEDVEYSSRVLMCPGCKKNGIDTPMPRGADVCPVCGHERKRPTTGERTRKKPKYKPQLPKFVECDLGDFYAQVNDEVTISVNSAHSCVTNLYNTVIQKFPELDQEHKDQVRQHAHDILCVEVGLTSIIAHQRYITDEWFDMAQLTAQTSSELLTFDALRTEKYVNELQKYANSLLKQQKKSQEFAESFEEVA